ncbi:MAG: 2-oxoglutarate dehydrogenase complex dihydrolipoyllysine-residue succinyltransferase [Deinococcota bacterium]|nr:2-oxoglutarate dehydrogenase complex dihydrolipoyllysine-residue succinyltransferase [Deinococcota bacterium]
MPVELKVPTVGESITEVEIGQWLKAEGDSVEKDEPLVEIETDKATVEVPAPSAGVLGKILKRAGEPAEVGEVIGHLEAGGAAAGKPEAKPKAQGTQESEAKGVEAERQEAAEASPAKTSPAETGEDAGEDQSAARPAGQQGGETRVMPAAQRLLAERGLQAAEVEATGPGGRLLKEDVLHHGKEQVVEEAPVRAPEPQPSQPSQPSPSSREEEAVPMSPLRRKIAERLVEAQANAALLTTFNEIDMSEVMALRGGYKDAFQEKYGVKLGFMSFFIKAAIDALKLIPQINAEIRGRDIVYKNYYDVGVAVGSGKGLVVPVLRDAQLMSFAEIEMAIADFARRARDNKLKPEELSGGTFTISNGGVYGSLLSTPIVNPPQSGVLGLHAINERPIAVSGEVVVRPMMYIALTYDHRIVDGREAVTFLKRIKEVMEKPSRMLLEV